MRRLLICLLAAGFLFAIWGGDAAKAESQTRAGTGDISKIVVNNGTNTLTTKVFGFGNPCGGAHYISVEVRNRNGRLLYHATGGCYPGATWATGLYYTATGEGEDETKVRCSRFEFKRVQSPRSYIIVMPRSCLDHAPDRVKVNVWGDNYGSTTGGEAGPTKLLNRG